jgi:hypothetical protein
MPAKIDLDQLEDTIKRINWQYGRGNVRSINLDKDTVEVEYGWGIKNVEHVKFRIVGNKVRFRGVTRTIGYKNRL